MKGAKPVLSKPYKKTLHTCFGFASSFGENVKNVLSVNENCAWSWDHGSIYILETFDLLQGVSHFRIYLNVGTPIGSSLYIIMDKFIQNNRFGRTESALV